MARLCRSGICLSVQSRLTAKCSSRWGGRPTLGTFFGTGDTHEHRSLYALNKMKSAHELVADIAGGDNTGKTFVPGMSRTLLVTLTGIPSQVITGGAVTTSGTQVGVTWTHKYKFSMHEPNVGDWDVQGTQFTNVGVTGYRGRQEDGDEVIGDYLE